MPTPTDAVGHLISKIRRFRATTPTSHPGASRSSDVIISFTTTVCLHRTLTAVDCKLPRALADPIPSDFRGPDSSARNFTSFALRYLIRSVHECHSPPPRCHWNGYSILTSWTPVVKEMHVRAVCSPRRAVRPCERQTVKERGTVICVSCRPTDWTQCKESIGCVDAQ